MPMWTLYRRVPATRAVTSPAAIFRSTTAPAADVVAAAVQAVGQVGVRLQVLAPGVAPERAGDGLALDAHRIDARPAACPAGRRPPRPGRASPRPRRGGEIRTSAAGASVPARRALRTSRLTSRRISSFDSSVRAAPASASASITCRLRSRLLSIRASMRSSSVPRQISLWTSTLRFWPMRKARSVAWSSTAGFHQRSKWMTWLAAVRFRPVPPARSDSTKNGGPSSAWNSSTSFCRRAHGGLARQHQPRPAEAPRQVLRPAARSPPGTG